MTTHDNLRKLAERFKRLCSDIRAVCINDEKAVLAEVCNALPALLNERDELKADAEIGKRWRENSSLEQWFPFTAQELAQAKTDIEALQGEIVRYSQYCLKRAEAFDALRQEVERLRGQNAALERAIGMDTSWPLHSVLAQLSLAARILLDDKDFDGHGHELIQRARKEAVAINARVAELLPPPSEGEKQK